jgi:RNA polymerase sigma-70 factor, ECF subfamily
LLPTDQTGVVLRAVREGLLLRRCGLGDVRLPVERRDDRLRVLQMDTTNEQVWRALYDRLSAFVARRVGPGEVDDLVQEVLLRIHRRIDSLDQADRLDAWAYQITRNAIVDHYRARARRVQASGEDSEFLEESAQHKMVSADDPEAVKAGRELAGCLTPLVEQLAEPYREAVGLVELEGVPQAQAAARLGISTSGMKSRVQRARRQLKDMLLDCCHVELSRRGSVVDYATHGGRCSACGPAAGQTCCSQ